MPDMEMVLAVDGTQSSNAGRMSLITVPFINAAAALAAS
jgi:hypothetical protein